MVLKLELDCLRGSIDDMTYEKEHGQNQIKIYEHNPCLPFGFRIFFWGFS